MKNHFYLVALFLLPCLYSAGQDSSWKEVAMSESRDVYYVRKTSSEKNGNKIKAWVKIEESPEGRKKTAANAIEIEQPSSNKISQWMNYSYRVVLYEFDCSARQTRGITSVYYDTKGNVLKSFDHDTINWQDVVPDSVFESVFEYVCNKN